MNFRSDNEAPVAPEIMEALARANAGFAHAYGEDPFSAELKQRFAEVFETQLEVFPVATGTAANALCIAQMTPRYGAALCHQDAHLYRDECGAPEFFSGGKLLPLPGADGKLDAATVAAKLETLGAHGDHESKPCALSVTQATEYGTVYRPEELRELKQTVEPYGLGMHMDGARLANAIAALDCSPAEVTWKAGVDMLSFGATKNGALAAEAVVVFKPDYAIELARCRKRAGHLFSKMRYISAQLNAYLADGLWLRLAQRANESARALAAGLAAAPEVELMQMPMANEVFARIPDPLATELQDAGFEFHRWPGSRDVYRLVTSFATDAAEVEKLIALAGAGTRDTATG